MKINTIKAIIIIWVFPTPGKILKIPVCGREVSCLNKIKHMRWGAVVLGNKIRKKKKKAMNQWNKLSAALWSTMMQTVTAR